MPTTDPNNPSFAPDPLLQAHFPPSIDGQPVTDVSSGSLAQFVCLGGSAELQLLQATATYDVTQLTWGTASALVDGDDIELFAYRLPGGDANLLLATLAGLAEASGGDSSIKSTGSGTAGGKSVTVTQNTDGTTSYGYVSGDTLIVAYDITQSQADKIFSAVT